MKKRLLRLTAVLAAVTAAGVIYALVYIKTGFGFKCPFYILTGLQCPGCGVTRMFVSIMRLDFVSAFRYNPAVFCMLPFFAFLLGRYVYSYLKGKPLRLTKAEHITEVAMICVLVVFGIARNIVK